MLKIKAGAFGARLNPVAAVSAMLIVVDQVMTELGFDYELTSGIEGEHMPGSLHYIGLAYDWTIRNPRGVISKDTLQNQVRDRLGDDFDVVWIADKYRLHVEYQPKRSYGRLGP